MRVEASILVEGAPEGVDVLSRQVSEDIVAYLKTASLAQFEGASGFQNLREDLMDRARVRGGEHIKDLIIHGIVVE
jgi:flagellar FliL protein